MTVSQKVNSVVVWHGFWLKDLDAQEAFSLSTEFRLARLCKQTRISTVHQVLYDKNIANIIRHHNVFLVNQTLLLENI